MDRRTDRDRQIDRYLDEQTDERMDGWTDKQTDQQINKSTDRQIVGWVERQIYNRKHVDRPADQVINRQIYRSTA